MTKKPKLPSSAKFTPPPLIEITSDGSRAKLIKTEGDNHLYEYTEGEFKKGMTVWWGSEYITTQLNNFFKKIK